MRRWHHGMIAAALAATLAIPASPREQQQGYLAPGEFDVTAILEPAPRPGDPRYETDRRIFRATRALAGSARWQLATSDAELGTRALMRDFSCAVGVQLTPETAPRLATVLTRASRDTAAQTGRAKDAYQRQRPFVIDRGRICQPSSELYDSKHGRMSYDYPSGHTTNGWTWALVLASLAPDRAQAILARGRAFGDSRFVCGAHNESAVEAGMLSATATMALVATKPDYQSDLAAARAELGQLRAAGPVAVQGCDAEAALVAQRVMPRLEGKPGPSGRHP